MMALPTPMRPPNSRLGRLCAHETETKFTIASDATRIFQLNQDQQFAKFHSYPETPSRPLKSEKAREYSSLIPKERLRRDEEARDHSSSWKRSSQDPPQSDAIWTKQEAETSNGGAKRRQDGSFWPSPTKD